MEKYLYDTSKVIELINEGRVLLLAGDEKKLDQLPDGNWIAGTTPYFMDTEGCCFNPDKIHVRDITEIAEEFKIVEYNEDNINNIVSDGYDNGFTVLILPAMQNIVHKFAVEVPDYPNLYKNPLVGWISGIKYENVGKDTAKVYSGKVKSEIWKDIELWLEEFRPYFGKIQIVGSGGNINKLTKIYGNYNRRTISYFQLQAAYSHLTSFNLQERIDKLGLRPDRADVIVPASEIFLHIMKTIDSENVYAPKIGLADGLIHILYQKYINNFDTVYGVKKKAVDK